jgi:APA family basic amino acid/polyamine antiporter
MAAMIMVCPRVYYAMASDGVFLKAVAQLHPGFATPVRAIGIMGLMTSLLIALGGFEQIVAYFLFVAVLFIGLTVAALFVFRRRSIPAPVRTPGYPVTPLIFLVQVVALLVLILMNTPWQALLGCAVVLLGLPVYTFLQHEHILPDDIP